MNDPNYTSDAPRGRRYSGTTIVLLSLLIVSLFLVGGWFLIELLDDTGDPDESGLQPDIGNGDNGNADEDGTVSPEFGIEEEDGGAAGDGFGGGDNPIIEDEEVDGAGDIGMLPGAHQHTLERT